MKVYTEKCKREKAKAKSELKKNDEISMLFLFCMLKLRHR
jgi:hypothetical protein